MFAPFTSEELYDFTNDRKFVDGLMKTTYKLNLLMLGIFVFSLAYSFIFNTEF